MQLHPKQIEVVKSEARFKVIRAGRRSGKSTLEIEEMVFTALSKGGRNIFYISPNQKQSRAIIWEALKSRLGGVGRLNESRLEVELDTMDGGKSRIYLAGFEARENFRGMKADLIVFDELDTMRDFFIGWQEIFRPALTDTSGHATFIGTPKKENPNLRRLEKIAENDKDYQAFHFTTKDNPHIDPKEIEKAKTELDYDTFKQEYLAEYLDHAGALFNYTSLVDVFSNTITKDDNKYLIVDIADDGSDKTIFSFWEGLEEYQREEYSRLNTEGIIAKIREYASEHRIPFSHIAVDAIGVGAGVASSSMLDGIIGFKSSYTPIKTDISPVRLPGVSYLSNPLIPLVSDYKNLRSQCVFTLAEHVNNHKIASRVSGSQKEVIIEELSTYQDASTGDGRRMAMAKERVKEILGRSPDHSDCFMAGTKVLTPSGLINIEDIKVGDLVSTPFGNTKVISTIEKTTDTLYKFDNLIGTGNHKIFSGSKFSTIDTYMMRVYTYYTYNLYNKIIWKILSFLSIKIKSIGFRVLVDTSTTAHTKMGSDKKEKHYTGLYGKILIKGEYLLDMMSTILTITILIMTRLIWLVLNLGSIILTTLKNIGGLILLKQKKILIRQEVKHLYGISQNAEDGGIQRMLKKVGLMLVKNPKYVRDARITMRVIEKMVSVVTLAYKSFIIELRNITKIGRVSFVDKLLVSGSLNKPRLVQELAVSKVENIKVYTLNLEKHNVYIANGVLVANCWIMRMYFEVMKRILPMQSEEASIIRERMQEQFTRRKNNYQHNSTK